MDKMCINQIPNAAVKPLDHKSEGLDTYEDIKIALDPQCYPRDITVYQYYCEVGVEL